MHVAAIDAEFLGVNVHVIGMPEPYQLQTKDGGLEQSMAEGNRLVGKVEIAIQEALNEANQQTAT
jgi:hypothetical protein